DIKLFEILQNAFDGVAQLENPASRGRYVRVFGLPVDFQRRIAFRIEIFRFQIGDSGQPLSRQSDPKPPLKLTFKARIVGVRQRELKQVRSYADAHENVAPSRIVHGACEGELLHLSDQHATKFHRRTDVQTLHRLFDVSFHEGASLKHT